MAEHRFKALILTVEYEFLSYYALFCLNEHQRQIVISNSFSLTPGIIHGPSLLSLTHWYLVNAYQSAL